MEHTVRQSVTLPAPIARRVRELAKRDRKSANRVIVDLIESGLEAREREKRTFFELADRLADSPDVAERKSLKKELARLTYGSDDYVPDTEMAEIRSNSAVQKRLRRGHREATARKGRFV
jgi:hypothetical protein